MASTTAKGNRVVGSGSIKPSASNGKRGGVAG